MRNWNDWSDYEINKAAVKFLGINFEDMSDFRPEPYIFNEDTQREFDLCNSWENLGHIMLDNGIGVVTEGGKLIGATNWYQQPYSDVIYKYVHENPCRAVSTCF